jgi:ribosome modulation factor
VTLVLWKSNDTGLFFYIVFFTLQAGYGLLCAEQRRDAMAFTRKCRKALRASRDGKATNLKRYHSFVDAGEEAYRQGEIKCPFENEDDRAAWIEGWYLAHEDAGGTDRRLETTA